LQEKLNPVTSLAVDQGESSVWMVHQVKAFFDAFDTRHKKTTSRSRWRSKVQDIELKTRFAV